MYYAKNPILPGFCPDPSICRAGEDYYLVTSSFAYFPGVPVFHSKDLAHWEQIGNALERESQLVLEGCGHSEGIFAPTIRYQDGVFYMVTTNISGGGNFIVTADTPDGPWSEPHELGEAAQGIDPSLFFDDDGTCYYVGTRPNQKGVRYNGDWEIWAQELDIETMRLTGESHKIWKGALHHGIWPEGPHLYKKDGFYYLIHAEGGTGMEHAVCAARSRQVFGPYEGSPCNPIFSHRHLGADYPVVMAGHGDLVEDGKGGWYIVMLGTRRVGGYGNTGRDTYLAKVRWENGWPVINPGIGKLEESVALPGEPAYKMPQEVSWHFYRKTLPVGFMTLRSAGTDVYRLCETEGCLRLYTAAEKLAGRGTPAYIGVRQSVYDFCTDAVFRFAPAEGEEAGIAMVCDENSHLRFVRRCAEGRQEAALLYCTKGGERLCAAQPLAEGITELRMVCRAQRAEFYCRMDGAWHLVARDIDLRKLSTEEAGGFTGCTVGMYASANGKASENHADFFYFSCTPAR